MVTPLTESEIQAFLLQKAEEDLKWCIAAAALEPFHAGDRVKHAPSGETWILACDQEDNEVMPAGWPETVAKATHCRSVERASDSARFAMLKAVAEPSPGRPGSKRHRLAARQLEALLVSTLSGNPSSPVAGLISDLESAIGREQIEIEKIESAHPGMFGKAPSTQFFDPGPSRYDRPPEDGS